MKRVKVDLPNDRWICSNCGNVLYQRPANRYVKCDVCNQGRYKLLRTCDCGKEFSPVSYVARYCSKECGYKYKKNGGKKGKHYPHLRMAKIKVCPVCGKEFRAIYENKNRVHIYCSKECWSHRKPPIEMECPLCGKHFMAYEGRQVYCSSECADKSRGLEQRGENSHFWKGGKTKEVILKRTSAEYKKWRLAVFSRDEFRCQLCGNTGHNLEAHHIKAVCDYPDLMFDVNNGVTLCHECHKTTENYGYKARWKKEETMSDKG